MYTLERGQAQMITFVMVDAAYNEVAGLGAGFILEISKAGGGFAPSTGVKGEIGFGWYYYILTALETDTVGPLSVRVNGAGCIQQNLEYSVYNRVAGAVEFTYTVNNFVTGLPEAGVEVWATTDLAGLNVVWNGHTDAFGAARDAAGRLPWLDPGTYYFWKKKPGFTDADNPDVEIVS